MAGKVRGTRILDGISAEQEMRIFLAFLNEDPQYARAWHRAMFQFKQWVEKWDASGRDMNKFTRDNPELWEKMQRHYKDNPPHLFPNFPDENGLALVWRFPAVLLRELQGEDPRMVSLSEMMDYSPEAMHLFISFLMNPLRLRTGGPCCRCRRYYLRRTARNPKVYCSRRCGSLTTARAATVAIRKKDHERKLSLARGAAHEWVKKGTDPDWKRWVSRKNPKISTKFLTRAVNRGELKEPSRREQRAR